MQHKDLMADMAITEYASLVEQVKLKNSKMRELLVKHETQLDSVESMCKKIVEITHLIQTATSKAESAVDKTLKGHKKLNGNLYFGVKAT